MQSNFDVIVQIFAFFDNFYVISNNTLEETIFARKTRKISSFNMPKQTNIPILRKSPNAQTLGLRFYYLFCVQFGIIVFGISSAFVGDGCFAAKESLFFNFGDAVGDFNAHNLSARFKRTFSYFLYTILNY